MALETCLECNEQNSFWAGRRCRRKEDFSVSPGRSLRVKQKNSFAGYFKSKMLLVFVLHLVEKKNERLCAGSSFTNKLKKEKLDLLREMENQQ